MRTELQAFQDELRAAGIALRLRGNRRRLLHLGRGRGGVRELVLHPLLTAEIGLLRRVILGKEATARPLLQEVVDRAGFALTSVDVVAQHAHLFTASELAALQALAADCGKRGIELELNDNTIQLLAVGRRAGRPRLDLHWRLVEELPGIHTALLAHLRRPDRGLDGALAAAMARVFARIRCERVAAEHRDPVRTPAALAEAVVIGPAYDHAAALLRIHAEFFPALPPVRLSWQRDPGARRLRSIRYGAYRRREQLISLHPRLRQPWVAQVFVEHVLHHELCHHAQACAPLRRERVHSARFRAWERTFPGYQLALAWERAQLSRLLAGGSAADSSGAAPQPDERASQGRSPAMFFSSRGFAPRTRVLSGPECDAASLDEI